MGRSYSHSVALTPGAATNITLIQLRAAAGVLLTITEIFYGPRAAPSATTDLPHIFGWTTDVSANGTATDQSANVDKEDPADTTTLPTSRLWDTFTAEPTYGGKYRRRTCPASGNFTWRGRIAVTNQTWCLRMLTCTSAVNTVVAVHWTEGML